MSRIELAPEVADDFDQILSHLAEHEVADAPSRLQDIIAAIDVLERNPLIGRPDSAGNRELVIGRGARGYVALYRYAEAIDAVFILAVRSQRETGDGVQLAGADMLREHAGAEVRFACFDRRLNQAAQILGLQPHGG